MGGVRCYLGSFVILGALGVLAGCSGGKFLAEREPWRHEAESSCIGSGAVREGEGKVRIKAINGPGMCGADFPLKVSSLGDTAPLGFGDDMRPPSGIPNGSSMPQRWPGQQPSYEPPYDAQPPRGYPNAQVESRPLGMPNDAGGRPMPLDPQNAGGAQEVYDFRKPYSVAQPQRGAPLDTGSPAYDLSPEPYDRRRVVGEPRPQSRRNEAAPLAAQPRRELGPDRTPLTAMAGPVSVTPAATLACPLVSVLDQWISSAVQPAAMRWFGQPVVEIKQISAYSCRGMNGDPNAHISEHAFGNALDIATFILADGRKITVEKGWHGAPEEQGFLRDVQGAACAEFTTVLAPGSNVYHYNHIHVDLMRRAGGRRACNPKAVPGEEIAARANGGRFVGRADVTGSVPRSSRQKRRFTPNAYSGDRLPPAIPGDDGED